MWKGDYYQALTLQEDALRMMEQRVNCRWYMWAATGASLAYAWLGRWEQAVAEGLKGRCA